MLVEASTLLIGFLAGLADFSVGAGFDVIAVPSLILVGVEPQVAIAEGLFAQVISSTLFGTIKRKTVLSRSGAVVIVASSASALVLSMLSLNLGPHVIESVLGFVLLMLSSVLVIRTVWEGSIAADDPVVGDGRLALLALGAGAVKGLAGSGMSAVMILGQLVMGIDMGKAVVMAVVSKSIPATAALIPRVLGHEFNVLGALLLTTGAATSIAIAEKAKEVLPPKVLRAVLCCYSVLAGSYLLLRATGLI